MTRIAINGFGRIGRNVVREATRRRGIDVVAINDLGDPDMLAYLLSHDSVHGRLEDRARIEDGHLVFAGNEIRFHQESDPAALPWRDEDVEVVVESTGAFTDATAAAGHLTAGAERVLISAPAKGADLTVVMGVNQQDYDGRQRILSNGSCTTNCAALMAQVLHRAFGIRRGVMNTVHATTNDQQILDLPHKDWRRGRAASANIIPTSTGAARAIGLVLPELAGRLDGMAMRVPVLDGSVVDLTVELDRTVTADQVNDAFQTASETDLAGLLDYTTEPIVSSDIVGSPASCTLDSALTMCIDSDAGSGSLVRAIGWYDNETGFAHRTLDLAQQIGRRP